MSQLYRYAACPGSVRLCEQAGPQPPSKYALEGTKAHELLETYLYGIRQTPEDASKDTLDAVNVALDYVGEIMDQYADAVLVVEQKFEIPSMVAPGQVWGTNDICIYVPSMRLLYVIDYKHGAGVRVELVGNQQLRGYGIGALQAHPEWDVDTVALVIVQPRVVGFALPIPEEWISAADLWAFRPQIDAAIARAMAPDAPLVPGPEQCKFCAAAVICPARERQALAVVGEAFGDVREVTPDRLPDVAAMTPDRIAYVLRAADLIEDWFARVREKGLELEKAGTHIPGRKIVEAQARRHFVEDKTVLLDIFRKIVGPDTHEPADQPEEIVAEVLAAITGWKVSAEKFLPPKLLGIGDTEKLIKDAVRVAAPKNKQKEAIAEAMAKLAFLTTKKSSGTLTLVDESDKRPAVDVAAAAFGDVSALPHITGDEP